MRMTWTSRLAIALACGSLAACGGGNAKDPGAETRRVQDERTGCGEVKPR